MSVLHYIKTKEPINFVLLQKIIERTLADVLYEQRSEKLCYFWIDGASTRGVDVSLERENWVEIRNTSFSNHADYKLTNELVSSICNLYKGEIYKENDDYDEDEDHSEEYIKTQQPIFSQDKWQDNLVQDASTMRIMIGQLHQTMTLFGPVRKTHFGINFINSFQEKTDQELAEIMENYCLNVNYNLPEYDYGNVMEAGEGDEAKIVKLITNEVNCIIDKYDYLLFSKSENQIIAVTNDDLNNILPKSWQRVDEYTIVAPILADSDFQNLITKAEKYNKIEELVN
jgi:hypothetical protein